MTGMLEEFANGSSRPEPPPDYDRSPETGWNRAHWEWAADVLLDGAARHATASHALVRFPGGRASMHGERSDGLEGFARTFLLAAFRLTGSGAERGALVDRYAAGLVAGTTPGHADAWPAFTHRSQPMIEAASVAIGLYESRPWIWEQLSTPEREHVVAWLSQVHGKSYWPNNWLLFRVMVNTFLKTVGAPHRADEVERDLDLIDGMYRRDGWYSDGPGRNYDHYVGWAIHLYTLLWARMDGDASDPERSAIYRARLRRYLEDVVHLFAASGAPLHQGRSLIYRFAALAPLGIGEVAGCSPLPAGVTRGIASRCLRHFLEHGAAPGGVLSMGWHRQHLGMVQPYSGPASPYWASKGFLGLLLPPDAPAWQAVEEPAPVQRASFVRALTVPGWLVQGSVEDGEVRIYNHGADHYPNFGASPTDPHYRKLAYACHAAPETGSDDVDSQVALLGPDGTPSGRNRIHPVGCFDRWAASVHFTGEDTVVDGRSFPLWLERVECVSIAHAGVEIRLLHVSSFGPRRLRTGGFATADTSPPACRSDADSAQATSSAGWTSAAVALHGFDRAGILHGRDTNASGTSSAIPYLETAENTGAKDMSACVVGFGHNLDSSSLRALVSSVTVQRRSVAIACADGTHYFVQLVAAEHVDRNVAGTSIQGPVRYARIDASGRAATYLDVCATAP